MIDRSGKNPGYRRWHLPGIVLVSMASCCIFAAGCRPAAEPERLELPRPPGESGSVSSARVIRLPSGGDLQDALDRSLGGDTIELEPGAVYQGAVVLPYKPEQADPESQWITIRSGGDDGMLPPAGVRVSPGDAGAMARLEAASGAIVSTAPGAHHYRFVGLEFRPSASRPGAKTGAALNALIALWVDEGSGEAVPHHLIIERCLLRGDPRIGARRGIILNSAATAVVDSHLADFKTAGEDSQAIIGWEGPGPFLIRNNYLEGAGENLMFGGADPDIGGRVPADIEILGNHFARPVAWRAGSQEYDGTDWTIKNLLELKNARRVLIDGNLFEHNWPESQNGFAILFTVRNQDGSAPWSVVEDITFSNNIVRHVASGINILGHDDNHASRQTRRIAIRNNLFVDLGGGWGAGDLVQLLRGTAKVVFEHNTALNTGNILLADGSAHSGFEFRNNIVRHNQFGITGTDSAPGKAVLERYFEGAVMRDNVIIGGSAEDYPVDNTFPQSIESIGFIDAAAGDFRLAAASPHRSAGRAAGVDFEALCRAISATEQPLSCKAP